MLTVVFGAGASYDSVDRERVSTPFDSPNNQYQPPLANGLFSDRPPFNNIVARYPAVAPLVRHLRGVVPETRSVEDELERISEQAETSKRQDLQERLVAVRYYLRDALTECGNAWFDAASGMTNYTVLFYRIRDWCEDHQESATLITFDYDKLLERAAESALGLQIDDMDSYIGSPRFKILKLHGSVDWAHPVGLPVSTNDRGIPQAMIANAAGLPVRPGDFIWLGDTRDEKRNDIPLVPAIAIPTRTKSGFEIPTDHHTALRECLTRTSKLLVIGWRAAEIHFLRLLEETYAGSDTVPQIHIVNGSGKDGMDTFNRLAFGRAAAPQVVFKGGFSRFLSSEDPLGEFLNA